MREIWKYTSSRALVLIYIPPILLISTGIIVWIICTLSLTGEREACFRIQKTLSKKLSLSDRSQLRRISKYQNSSSAHLKKHLMQRPLLQREVEKLNDLSKNPLFPIPPTLIKRRQWILSLENRLSFEENWEGKKGGISESLEKLVKPVQLDTEDLFYLLSLIEGKQSADIPHLIITEMKLSRLQITEGWDVFQLENLEMIKRDYTCILNQ